MPKHVLSIIGLLLIVASPAIAQPACPPSGYSRSQLVDLKSSEWRIESEKARAQFARAIVACLADEDPVLRDELAYGALFTLLRGRQLSTGTMISLQNDLTAMATGPAGEGFARPFAVLALAEIARADRIEPYLGKRRRAALIDTAVAYLIGVDDYRGFDEREGWRHGVAHGADLALQLALNPAVEKPDLARLRDAVGKQIAPPDHSYIFGEGERLARPILYIAQRDMFSSEEWTSWLASVCSVDENSMTTSAGLARRHNVTAFLTMLHAQVTLNANAADDALAPGLVAAIKALP